MLSVYQGNLELKSFLGSRVVHYGIDKLHEMVEEDFKKKAGLLAIWSRGYWRSILKSIKAKIDMRMLDILITGHCTHDIIIRKDKKFFRLGGPPAYISRLVESLNKKARKEKENRINYTIVSKVGPDFKYFSQLSQKPVRTSSVVLRNQICQIFSCYTT